MKDHKEKLRFIGCYGSAVIVDSPKKCWISRILAVDIPLYFCYRRNGVGNNYQNNNFSIWKRKYLTALT